MNKVYSIDGAFKRQAWLANQAIYLSITWMVLFGAVAAYFVSQEHGLITGFLVGIASELIGGYALHCINRERFLIVPVSVALLVLMIITMFISAGFGAAGIGALALMFLGTHAIPSNYPGLVVMPAKADRVTNLDMLVKAIKAARGSR